MSFDLCCNETMMFCVVGFMLPFKWWFVWYLLILTDVYWFVKSTMLYRPKVFKWRRMWYFISDKFIVSRCLKKEIARWIICVLIILFINVINNVLSSKGLYIKEIMIIFFKKIIVSRCLKKCDRWMREEVGDSG